ncbi:hypothetical protein [Mycobacterium marinum]|uniref:hypothetical protein n=1 Tax=Mycobacterium marinum TaxID=1781 RepID=UPI0021C3B851|nr:hypothetical protein [Mycobacterium marinum]
MPARKSVLLALPADQQPTGTDNARIPIFPGASRRIAGTGAAGAADETARHGCATAAAEQQAALSTAARRGLR